MNENQENIDLAIEQFKEENRVTRLLNSIFGPKLVLDLWNSYKRRCLFFGNCGQSGRVRIEGQVLDIIASHKELKRRWDPFLHLSSNQFHNGNLRPVYELLSQSVRRACIQLKIFPQDFDASKHDTYTPIHSFPKILTKDNGVFSVLVPSDIGPGNYTVAAYAQGVRSLRQSIKDLRFLGRSSFSSVALKEPIGCGRLSIADGSIALEPNVYTSPASKNQSQVKKFKGALSIISDLDQSFLITKQRNILDVSKRLTEHSKNKKPYPGMPELYRQLLKIKANPANLIFLSASPHFFRRSLELLFKKYHVPISGLYLKSIGSIWNNILNELIDEFFTSDKGSRNVSEPKEIPLMAINKATKKAFRLFQSNLQGFYIQIDYKMHSLLEKRLMQATHTKEILIGDNTRSDYICFVLYQLFLSMRLPKKTDSVHQNNWLYRFLMEMSFQGGEVLSERSVEEIYQLIIQNQAIHGNVNPVVGVFIHDIEKVEGKENDLEADLDSILCSELHEHWQQDQDMKKGYLCEGSLGMSLAAFDEGLLTKANIKRVALHNRKEGVPQEKLEDTMKKFHFRYKKEYKGNLSLIS